jgi:hypothetical protein
VQYRQVILAAATFLLLALAGYWLASPGNRHDQPLPADLDPTAVASPADTPPEKPSLKPLLEDLTSTDPALKSAALQELAHLPPDRRNDLRASAQKTLLPELSALLLQRASDMDDEIALNPPPVSLHVHGAVIDEVVFRLATATGTDIQAHRTIAGRNVFSLDAVDKPFWEIIAALHRQFPLKIVGGYDTITIGLDTTIRVMPLTCVRGPFIMFGRYVDANDRFYFDFAADPRTPLVGCLFKWSVVDDTGMEFPLPNGESNHPAGDLFAPRNGNQTDGSVSVKPFHDANLGRTIVAYKVHARLGVGLQNLRGQATGIEISPTRTFPKNAATLPVGNAIVAYQISDFTFPREIHSTQFDISVKRGNANAYETHRFLDSLGKPIIAAAGLNGLPPYTLQIRVPQKIEYFDVDFELKPAN